jgi:hypothetical protein
MPPPQPPSGSPPRSPAGAGVRRRRRRSSGAGSARRRRRSASGAGSAVSETLSSGVGSAVAETLSSASPPAARSAASASGAGSRAAAVVKRLASASGAGSADSDTLPASSASGKKAGVCIEPGNLYSRDGYGYEPYEGQSGQGEVVRGRRRCPSPKFVGADNAAVTRSASASGAGSAAEVVNRSASSGAGIAEANPKSTTEMRQLLNRAVTSGIDQAFLDSEAALWEDHLRNFLSRKRQRLEGPLPVAETSKH